MAKVRASDVGFCVVDSNANVIADNLVHRIREAPSRWKATSTACTAADRPMISMPARKIDLAKPSSAGLHGPDPARRADEAQIRVVYLQAAE